LYGKSFARINWRPFWNGLRREAHPGYRRIAREYGCATAQKEDLPERRLYALPGGPDVDQHVLPGFLDAPLGPGRDAARMFTNEIEATQDDQVLPLEIVS